MKLENFLWNFSKKEITKHFKIVDTLNIVEPVANINERFISFFEKHKDRTFKENEKLFIIFSDTQYYLPGSKFGINLYNFFQQLKQSQIESSNIIFSVNRPGYVEEISWLNHYYNFNTLIFLHNCDKINCLEHTQKVDLNIDKIEYGIGFTNGARRFHRLLFLCLLEEMSILEKTVYSCNFNGPVIVVDDTKSNNDSFKNRLPNTVSINPHVNINENIIINKKYNDIFSKHSNKFINSITRHKCIDPMSTDIEKHWYPSYIQKCFVHLVSETVFDYPTPYISEKTFKCILNKRPFLLISSANSLKFLRDLGFKTFENFWDESYDNKEDINIRISKIISVTKYLADLNKDEYKKIIKEMENILNYNHDNYISLLKENFSTNLKKVIDDDKKIKAALARQ